jgi:hypothetical protein
MQNKDFTEEFYIQRICTERIVSLVAGLIHYQEHNLQYPGIEGSDVLLIQLVPVLWR